MVIFEFPVETTHQFAFEVLLQLWRSKPFHMHGACRVFLLEHISGIHLWICLPGLCLLTASEAPCFGAKLMKGIHADTAALRSTRIRMLRSARTFTEGRCMEMCWRSKIRNTFSPLTWALILAKCLPGGFAFHTACWHTKWIELGTLLVWKLRLMYATTVTSTWSHLSSNGTACDRRLKARRLVLL